MRLEHLGVVVGADFDDFSNVHRAALIAQQFQSLKVRGVHRPVSALTA
jgi:hypothetical protein